jgi:hypothetical protein
MRRLTEEYNVDLSSVTLLDLIIDPDKENGKAQAPGSKTSAKPLKTCNGLLSFS